MSYFQYSECNSSYTIIIYLIFRF